MIDLTFKNHAREELATELYDNTTYEWKIKILEERYSISKFENFKYFSPEDLVNWHDKSNYLVTYHNKKIVGVIKYGVFGHEEKEYGICYIDVNNEFKRRGIAKELITELNKYLDLELKLYISKPSDEGELCKINDLFKGLITRRSVITYGEKYG